MEIKSLGWRHGWQKLALPVSTLELRGSNWNGLSYLPNLTIEGIVEPETQGVGYSFTLKDSTGKLLAISKPETKECCLGGMVLQYSERPSYTAAIWNRIVKVSTGDLVNVVLNHYKIGPNILLDINSTK